MKNVIKAFEIKIRLAFGLTCAHQRIAYLMATGGSNLPPPPTPVLVKLDLNLLADGWTVHITGFIANIRIEKLTLKRSYKSATRSSTKFMSDIFGKTISFIRSMNGFLA